ncbi:glycoside hydrolase family 78 protein [Xylogone sp. PMI_703]|nr:glycoside hydrolase family 78 protein [Xylogone sp. PMI_703]
MASPKVSAPTFEHHPDGLGIGHSKPRLSWRFSGDASDWLQESYDLEVKRQGKTDLFHVESQNSVLVPWPGDALSPREAATLRVRVYGRGQKTPTEWSPWATVEVALLQNDDWTAQMVTSSEKLKTEQGGLRPLCFRKIFEATDRIVSARLYITSHGLYEAYVNGLRVGDHALAPGWTSYPHRLPYQTYDITAQLQKGENVLAVEVGEGWYAGRLGWGAGRRFVYGDELGVLAQLEIIYETGELQRINSDDSWKWNTSAILSSEIYDGEIFDARREIQGWNDMGFDESAWKSVVCTQFPTAKLFSPDAPPIRTTQEVKVVDIITSPKGKTILDFGQNLVGVVQIHSLLGATEQRITLVHAEVLEDGEVATRPLRNAKATDTVILSSDVLTNWAPKFTFHGFRYVEINGWVGTLNKDNFTARVMHSDMKRRGWFSCSDDLVNKLHENTVWSMRGNFLSVPTDCPQRDERLGWTGDAQVFAPSATFLYDSIGVLSNWLEDVSVEQLAKEDGIPGLVVPDVIRWSYPIPPQTVWHDVAVITPWDLYTSSADAELLRRQYNSMKAWWKAIPRGSDGLWDVNTWQHGDWLDPTAPPDAPANGKTDGILVADTYLVHISKILSKVCSKIGDDAEAKHFASESERLTIEFQKKWITPRGLLVNNTQTAVSLAVRFGLYPAHQLSVAAASLSRLVKGSKFRIATGFAGTPVICHALTATKQSNLAYRMLLERHCPSWLYPVTMGATTIWERWDSMLPDGRVNPGEMTSFNHYALGSVVDWLHTTVGGISSDDGWRTVLVQPVPGGGLKHAEAAFDGPYGRVECKWVVVGDMLRVTVVIPPNSTAVVRLPSSDGHEQILGSGRHSLEHHYAAEQWPPSPAPFNPFAVKDCDCCTN